MLADYHDMQNMPEGWHFVRSVWPGSDFSPGCKFPHQLTEPKRNPGFRRDSQLQSIGLNLLLGWLLRGAQTVGRAGPRASTDALNIDRGAGLTAVLRFGDRKWRNTFTKILLKKDCAAFVAFSDIDNSWKLLDADRTPVDAVVIIPSLGMLLDSKPRSSQT